MPGHEFVDTAVGPAIDEAGQQLGEVALRVDAVQLACLDQGGEIRPAAAPLIAAGEQGVLSADHQGPDGALDGVGVELDAAIVEEPGQTVPVVQGEPPWFFRRPFSLSYAARAGCSSLA